MGMSDTCADFPVIASVTAPATGGTPVSIASQLSAEALARIGTAQVVSVEVVSATTDIHVRDSADTAGRPNDYTVAPVTLACVNALSGIFVISSGASALAKLILHCRRTKAAPATP